MKFEEIRGEDKKYIANTYNRFAVDLERGEGATLYSAEGKK